MESLYTDSNNSHDASSFELAPELLTTPPISAPVTQLSTFREWLCDLLEHEISAEKRICLRSLGHDPERLSPALSHNSAYSCAITPPWKMQAR